MGKNMDEDRPNTGVTPIPSRSGLIYLTPSLYGTLLLVVYFVLAILTILFPSEPIKCSKEAVCQLRPCFMDDSYGIDVMVRHVSIDSSHFNFLSFLFSLVFSNFQSRYFEFDTVGCIKSKVREFSFRYCPPRRRTTLLCVFIFGYSCSSRGILKSECNNIFRIR